ncbi:hypothetical protein HKD37_01G001159 [Glycine soja]
MKEMKREKHASYSSHNSCKSLSEELRDYYEGRHRSHLRPHSHRRERERKPQEANIILSYFHGKDNVEANLDWEIRVEQQLKKKSTSKSYGSHSYPKKDQGQGILGVTPSKPKDDKGKTIEKQAPKASMQEKTSSIKCFKCLGRGHITSQCPTTKTMIMRGQDIYSSQDKATTSPSFSESEEAKGEESSEEIYPQEEGQPLVVKEKCKEVSVSSKRLAKKETHFTIKTNIKETFPLRQPPHFLFCKKTLASIATPLGLEVIPQEKELMDEGLVRKSLNPCALLVPKIACKLDKFIKIAEIVARNLLSLHRRVSDLDIDEEEVLKLATLGNGANSKDTIDTLKRCMVMRNRSYKELMAKCNILGRGKARYSKKLEKAKEKITKLKTREEEQRVLWCQWLQRKQENLPERDDGSEKGGFATRAQPGWLCETLRCGSRTMAMKRVALRDSAWGVRSNGSNEGRFARLSVSNEKSF